MAKKSPVIPVLLIIGVILLLALAPKLLLRLRDQRMVPPTPPEGAVCTMEAKQCPDGSYVGRTGPNCEFTACPVAIEEPTVQSGWKSYTVNDLGLTFSAPSDLTVTYETQRNDKGEPDVTTLYVQNGSANPKTYYQLYGLYQWNMPNSENTLAKLSGDLQPGATQTTISSYPAISGQIKGQRNRFVTYILLKDGKFGLFTAEPTEANRLLSEQIMKTFHFSK